MWEPRERRRHRGRRTRAAIAVLALGAAAIGLVGCGPPADPHELTIVYSSTPTFTALDAILTDAVPRFEAEHPGTHVRLQPIASGDETYTTKLSLMLRSPASAPDIFYEDSFMIRADAAAGYLAPLDDRIAAWPDATHFLPATLAGVRGEDGRIFGIPLGTDTRALVYSVPVFQRAGIDVPWQPRSWDDVLDAARRIRDREPGVTPFSMTVSKASGQGGIMQGIGMLIAGTGYPLLDERTGRWQTGSPGLLHALEFTRELFDDNLSTRRDDALDPRLFQQVLGADLPNARLGMTLDGSWVPSFWKPGGPFAWPNWATDTAVAAFPTEHGEPPGRVSLSGGWALSMSAHGQHQDLAFDFLRIAGDAEHELKFAVSNAQIAVRDDVAAAPEYRESGPLAPAFAALVPVTEYRPATPDYPAVSAKLLDAVESVVTARASPAEAAARFDRELTALVGADHVQPAVPR